jgi:hypothetical protein
MMMLLYCCMCCFAAACAAVLSSPLFKNTHLCVVEHDDATHEPEHVVQAGRVLQVLTLLRSQLQQTRQQNNEDCVSMLASLWVDEYNRPTLVSIVAAAADETGCSFPVSK